MKYIDKFQGPEVSFWEVFPYTKDIGLFGKLYKADRSKEKNRSSKVMWHLSLAKDIDSEFYPLEDKEQMDMLVDVLGFNALDYLGSKEEFDLYMSYFENFMDTVITADIRSMEQKLIERKSFIQNTPYSLDEMIYPEEGESFRPYLRKGTAAQLDKMMVDTKNIHEEIRKLREAARDAQSDSGKAGRVPSFLDS